MGALAGCKTTSGGGNTATLVSGVANAAAQPEDDAPPADETGGFDGRRAFAEVAKQVGFGPRPSGSPAIAQLQEYIQSELASYGCKVETDAFSADTPAGRLPMKNIVAKIPGDKLGILILPTHYDTKRVDDFVDPDNVAPPPT